MLGIGFSGPSELIVIGLILVLLFGAKKLPELARSMGSSVTQFKRGLKESNDESKDSPSGRLGGGKSEDDESKGGGA